MSCEIDIETCKESSVIEVTSGLVERGVEKESEEKEFVSGKVDESLLAPKLVSTESENQELTSDKVAHDLNNEESDGKESNPKDVEFDEVQIPSNAVSYHQNHRYGNSSKDDEESDSFDSTDEHSKHEMMIEGESSESVFSFYKL